MSVLLVHVHIVASVELMTLSIFKMVGNDMDSHLYDFSRKNSSLGAREARVWSRCYELRVLYNLVIESLATLSHDSRSVKPVETCLRSASRTMATARQRCVSAFKIYFYDLFSPTH